jgi:hypothetical protein
MIRRRVARDLPVRYAGAALDFNPIHLFDDAARAAGLDGAVLHGMCTLGWVADALERAAGAPLTHLSARFARPLRVGEAVEITPTADGLAAAVLTPDGEEVLRAVRARVTPPTLDAALPATRRSARYAVGREKIAELRAALEIEGPADLAPPTFDALVARAAVFGALTDAGIPLDGTIHAAQQLDRLRPYRDGDGVDTDGAIVDDRTRGGLRRLVVRAVSRVAGDVVSVSEWTLLRRDQPMTR